MRRWVPLLLAFLSSTAFAQANVSGPATAKVGAQVEVTVAGSKNPRDFVTIVEKSAREGAYASYQYVNRPSALKLVITSQSATPLVPTSVTSTREGAVRWSW